MNIKNQLKQCQHRVNSALEHYLPTEKTEPHVLHQAMRYAVLGDGKRIRAALTYFSGELVNADPDGLDLAAASIELIHAFSLIHDDLPALDNDDLRRGKLSCHKAFDEYTAILAGDALQSMAFELLAKLRKRDRVSNSSSLGMVEVLSQAIGSRGMAAGEYLDLAMTDLEDEDGIKALKKIYTLKTSKLLLASVMLGLLAGNCKDTLVLANMSRFSLLIGIAFQIHDDILEVEQSSERLGKSNMSDADNKKPTYITLSDLQFAKKQERYFHEKAMHHLDKTGLNVGKLAELSNFIIHRTH